MRPLRLIVAGGLLLAACGCASYRKPASEPAGAAAGRPQPVTAVTPTPAPPIPPMQVDCATVRCAACPDGQTPALKPPDCCRCVPVDTGVKPCENVRCAACPTGQHPAMKPPDCCRCIAGGA
jgi:hypothetical protein